MSWTCEHDTNFKVGNLRPAEGKNSCKMERTSTPVLHQALQCIPVAAPVESVDFLRQNKKQKKSKISTDYGILCYLRSGGSLRAVPQRSLQEARQLALRCTHLRVLERQQQGAAGADNPAQGIQGASQQRRGDT